MDHVVHPRESQGVQRRVSYRRPRDTEDSSSNDGSESLLLPDVDTGDGSSVMRAPSFFNGSCEEDEGEGGDRDGDLVNVFASSLLTPRSLWREAWLAVREGACFVGLTTTVAAVACLFVVAQLSSHERGSGAAERPHLPARRIPPRDEQIFMHDSRMRGATTMRIGRQVVVLQGATVAGEGGHLRLPDPFYQGVHLGLSAWDEWGEKLSREQNRERNSALRAALEDLEPRPTAVYYTTFEGGVEGFTVAYIAGALGRQQGRSTRDRSDPVWEEAEKAVMAVARRFQQLVVMKWHPNVWGPGHQDDQHLHTSVLQEVRPTRTGLRALASTVAVYHVQKATAVKAAGPDA